MRPERGPMLSENDSRRARLVAERLENSESKDYFVAVRQVLTNECVTDESDIQNAFKKLGAEVDTQRRRIRNEKVTLAAADEAEMLAEHRARSQFDPVADAVRVAAERGDDLFDNEAA